MCGQSIVYNIYATLANTNLLFKGFSCSQNVSFSSQRDNSTKHRKRANFPESIEFSGISLYYTNEVYECPCNFAIRASLRTFE